jgi:hypothetical protein
MFNAKNFEATASVSLADVPRLGTTIKGKKASGMEVKLSFTVYKCSEMFDDIIETYKNTGVLPTFEAQVTAHDAATAMGRSTKIYHDCVIDGDVLLSAFDADGGLRASGASAQHRGEYGVGGGHQIRILT